MDRWIIQPNVLGGWDVKAREAPKPSFQTSTRKEAEDWAQTASVPGDTVVVVNRTGQTLNRITIPGEAPALKPSRAPGARTQKTGHADQSKTTPAAPKVSAVGGPVAPPQPPMRIPVQPYELPQPAAPGIPEFKEEGERLNVWIDFGLPIAAAIGAPFFSPELVKEAEGGWIAIFVATLTWSLGCAIATYSIIGHRLGLRTGFLAAVGSLLGAWFFASMLGVGVLNIDMEELKPRGGGGHVWGWGFQVLWEFFSTAVITYGPFGTIVSGGIGIWIGYRAAQRLHGA